MTIPEHFASVVARFPDHPAVIARAPAPADAQAPPHETTYSYADLDRVSDLLADGLAREAGVRRGDRVCVSLGNGPEFAALTYAVFKLGAVLVPLNPAFTAAQVAAALDHLDAAVLVLAAATDLPYKPGRGRSNRDLLAALLGGGRGVPSEPSVPSVRRVVVLDNTADHAAVAASGDFAFGAVSVSVQGCPSDRLTSFSALTAGHDIRTADGLGELAKRPAPRHTPVLSPADTINIQFTSGTTAQPKAAMLAHRAILNNGWLIGGRLGLGPADRVVCPPPLFHCFGCVLGYMATATTGAALLLPSPAFDPRASLQMAAAHRATMLYGVSTMFVAMLEVADDAAVLGDEARRVLQTHLRSGIAAGSSVPAALLPRLRAALGLRDDLAICYGMTETSPVSCMTDPVRDPAAARAATVGRPLPHTGVKIVDPADRGRIVPRGVPGELAVSGYGVMQGYWGEAERTAEVLVWGPGRDDDNSEVVMPWMHSGDEATMDADGYVAVTGRIKDVVIRAGENIHPLEIENCLFGHPAVAEASVVGVPDARYGEVVAVFVVPHHGVRVRGGIAADEGAGGLLTEEEGGLSEDEGGLSEDEGAFSEDEGGLSEDEGPLSADDVRAWVRERLSPHLVPTHVLWATTYPKTASGKIQKFKLRETAKGLLNMTA